MRRMRGDLCSYAGAMSDMTRVSNLTIASVGTRDYALDVRSLRFPVLVLTGRKDPMPLDDSEAWAAAFPDARLVIVERAGHFPHVEQPQLVFATIDSFLRGNWPASAKRVERQPNER
jgi:pimeloyl-ACP methyl ester carboxylesterase